ncbi:IclR family transcriptional regulator [Hoeflea sp.]|uniref:IclR family transcriptional regulator n=1 Tax=Hoeflea sp. TaxID=1940281 RepID=UPI0025BB8516|nr:IclR family transcriptional regulator [Hoeflea sp.]|tara:strand:- start:264623 stop:265531 length:909 start_codon:yes stop_codon:yes gene_type:complete
MTANARGDVYGVAADRLGYAHDGDRKFVTALARGLEVLRCFHPRDGFLSNQEIAERTNLPKPTVTRLTYTLCQLGYLMQIPRLGKYQLAPGTITLGYAALANLGIRHVAREFMDQAAEALAAPVALGVLDRSKALYVGISRGSATFTVQLEIGSRIPLVETAMGQALLVSLPEAEREEHLALAVDKHPEKGMLLRKTMDRAVADYEQYGFVVSTGEWRPDIFAAGAPLVAADGSGTYAFNCGAPPHHFPPERLYNEVGPVMASLVRVVDDALNGRRPHRPDETWMSPSKTGGTYNRPEHGGP